jgi:hypothetical protein
VTTFNPYTAASTVPGCASIVGLGEGFEVGVGTGAAVAVVVAVSDVVGVASDELLPTTAPRTPITPAKQLAASNKGSATMRIIGSGRIDGRCDGVLCDISGTPPYLSSWRGYVAAIVSAARSLTTCAQFYRGEENLFREFYGASTRRPPLLPGPAARGPPGAVDRSEVS